MYSSSFDYLNMLNTKVPYWVAQVSGYADLKKATALGCLSMSWQLKTFQLHFLLFFKYTNFQSGMRFCEDAASFICMGYNLGVFGGILSIYHLIFLIFRLITLNI